MKEEIWIHKKTGNYYELLYDNAVDATNERGGIIVVVYRNQEGQIFVREKNEFFEKFERK